MAQLVPSYDAMVDRLRSLGVRQIILHLPPQQSLTLTFSCQPLFALPSNLTIGWPILISNIFPFPNVP
jgi:hypothetical protein